MNGTKSTTETAAFFRKEKGVGERSILVEAEEESTVDGIEVIMRT